jgi:hypothetical protein
MRALWQRHWPVHLSRANVSRVPGQVEPTTVASCAVEKRPRLQVTLQTPAGRPPLCPHAPQLSQCLRKPCPKQPCDSAAEAALGLAQAAQWHSGWPRNEAFDAAAFVPCNGSGSNPARSQREHNRIASFSSPAALAPRARVRASRRFYQALRPWEGQSLGIVRSDGWIFLPTFGLRHS